jgi:hypothetical protein
MIEQATARPWSGRAHDAAEPDDELLGRLALWLADVAAETVLAIGTQDAISGFLDAKPEQVPAPVVSP